MEKARADFSGKKVLIMGLGILGGGSMTAKFFVEHGAIVTVTDLKNKEELASSLALLKSLPIRYVLGGHREEDFRNHDLIIRNPDVPPDSPFLKIARKEGIPCQMSESLFMRMCPVSVIGVTGTRGKSTTAALIVEIFRKAGFHTLVGGNMKGQSTLSLLDEMKFNSKVILELSSWQLQWFHYERISPQTAVITNIYPDHLNRYKSMKDYIGDKKAIFAYQKKGDFLILNSENKITESFAPSALGKVIFFQKNDWPEKWKLKLRGEHNRENAAAALSAGRLFKISDKIIEKAAGNFPGLEHRLEKIRVLDGITYINDSASTTPIAGIMALRAFKPKPIILIAGGNTKNLDFTDFVKEFRQVKAIAFLEGTATKELTTKIEEQGVRSKILGRFNELKKAISKVRKEAKKGDVILFSPACTSFGMFKNEFDRGEQFKKIIEEI